MKMRLILLSLTFIVLASILGPWLSPYSLSEVSAARLAPPSFSHWLGPDLHGRDLLTRRLYGGRISLLVGLVGATVSLLVGVTYGLISGYLGGRTDNAMMRFVDILYALPRIILVIVLITLFDLKLKQLLDGTILSSLASHARLLLLFVGLGLVEWLTLILEESFLSFLGLGVQAPLASWGTLLADGAALLNPIQSPWWCVLFPALLLALTLLILNFLGDQLRQPKK